MLFYINIVICIPLYMDVVCPCLIVDVEYPNKKAILVGVTKKIWTMAAILFRYFGLFIQVRIDLGLLRSNNHNKRIFIWYLSSSGILLLSEPTTRRTSRTPFRLSSTQGMFKSKFNIILSYRSVFLGSGFHKINYLDVKEIYFKFLASKFQKY